MTSNFIASDNIDTNLAVMNQEHLHESRLEMPGLTVWGREYTPSELYGLLHFLEKKLGPNWILSDLEKRLVS